MAATMMFLGLGVVNASRKFQNRVEERAHSNCPPVCSRLRALGLIPVLVLIAGRRTIIGHGVSADGDGDVQGRLHDDSRQSQSEFRRCCPCPGPSYPAVHGVGQWHHARHPGYQPIRVSGQSRVLRSSGEQRESAMIMEIHAKGNEIVARETGIGYLLRFADNFFDNFSLQYIQALNIISTRYTSLSRVKRKDIPPFKVFTCVYVLRAYVFHGDAEKLIFSYIYMKSLRKLIILRRLTLIYIPDR